LFKSVPAFFPFKRTGFVLIRSCASVLIYTCIWFIAHLINRETQVLNLPKLHLLPGSSSSPKRFVIARVTSLEGPHFFMAWKTQEGQVTWNYGINQSCTHVIEINSETDRSIPRGKLKILVRFHLQILIQSCPNLCSPMWSKY